jgi:hypothetical protein
LPPQCPISPTSSSGLCVSHRSGKPQSKTSTHFNN